MVERELDRVDKFCDLKTKELEVRLIDTYRSLSRAVVPDDAELEGILQEVGSVSQELILLDQFHSLNVTGFLKLFKKSEKKLKGSSAFLLNLLRRKKFSTLKFDGYILAIGDIHSMVREAQQASEPSGEVWDPPSSFARKTTKYWVLPENVTAVKLAVVKHLPVLLFGSGEKAADRLEEISKTGVRNVTDSSAISSVYVDSPDFLCYHSRLEQKEDAFLVRYRWYAHGDILGTNKEMFIERKTHHESWVEADSLKERFPMRERNLVDWLTTASFKSIEFEDEPLAGEVRQQMLENQLQPVCRTVYSRTAFQLSSSNDVRVSLDTNLRISNEAGPRKIKHWCRPLSDLSKADIYKFPYAVLEIKLQGDPPGWVEELLSSELLIPAQKFSKFLTGCVKFHSEHLEKLPYWAEYPELQTDLAPRKNSATHSATSAESIPSSSNSHLMETRPFGPGDVMIEMSPLTDRSFPRPAKKTKDNFFRLDNDDSEIKSDSASARGVKLPIPTSSFSFSNLSIPLLGIGPKSADSTPAAAFQQYNRGKSKVFKTGKTAPKTYFANERTFIQWLSASLFILSLSIALLELGNYSARFAGIAFFIVSLMFICYALGIWQWRLSKLTRKDDSSYEDRVGPYLLVVFIVGAMLAVGINRVWPYVPPDENLIMGVSGIVPDPRLYVPRADSWEFQIAFDPIPFNTDRDKAVFDMMTYWASFNGSLIPLSLHLKNYSVDITEMNGWIAYPAANATEFEGLAKPKTGYAVVKTADVRYSEELKKMFEVTTKFRLGTGKEHFIQLPTVDYALNAVTKKEVDVHCFSSSLARSTTLRAPGNAPNFTTIEEVSPYMLNITTNLNDFFNGEPYVFKKNNQKFYWTLRMEATIARQSTHIVMEMEYADYAAAINGYNCTNVGVGFRIKQKDLHFNMNVLGGAETVFQTIRTHPYASICNVTAPVTVLS
eukprot:GILJ01006144.1.p1 GENE.GILJ01006144.1~~GILJ01006144.1.p1  ORF type:complete len:1035 (-),score=198.45 GILJ01006144.1:482-3319(-)